MENPNAINLGFGQSPMRYRRLVLCLAGTVQFSRRKCSTLNDVTVQLVRLRCSISSAIFSRYKKGSMIFCSQFDVKGWRDKIGSQIVADAICDRIVHDSYRVVIECRESMRKLFGIDKES